MNDRCQIDVYDSRLTGIQWRDDGWTDKMIRYTLMIIDRLAGRYLHKQMIAKYQTDRFTDDRQINKQIDAQIGR